MNGTLDRPRLKAPQERSSPRADGPRSLRSRAWDGCRALSARLVALLRLWSARARDRDLMRHFTERDLRDIGLTRAQARWEIDKPFWRA
jgi:uncharacterized protein YjiS (DUF1127 family)